MLLLGVPALPLRTGAATHLLEAITVLLALELIAGRQEIWLPRRWARLRFGGPTRRRFVQALLALIRFLERVSRPRPWCLFDHRLSNVLFGAIVAAGSIAAFLAPSFSGLDTLPALDVVLVSLGVLRRAHRRRRPRNRGRRDRCRAGGARQRGPSRARLACAESSLSAAAAHSGWSARRRAVGG